jgi:ribosomal-protein-alanine N-acetyltransferase
MLDPAKVVIRKMEAADLDQVVAIDQVSFSLPWPASSFKYELNQNQTSRCWVAEFPAGDPEARVIAMAVVWMIIDELHIATIAVLPEFRHLRVGQKLLGVILKDAVNLGAVNAFLEVRETNRAARAMYQKFGFKEVGKRPHYYSDTQEDAILMNLEPIQPDLLDVVG